MGLISTPSKFTAQPSYAPIDRSGIAGNAKFLFNPAGGTADLVNGRVWTPNGSAKIIGTPVGQAFDFNGSGSYLSFTGYPEMSGAIGTLALWFSRVGAASTFGHIYLSDSNGMYFQIDHTGKPYAWATSASASLSGSWFGTINRSLIFASLDGTAGGLKVYVDGADTGITFSAVPNAFSASSKTLNLGRYTGGSSWDANASLVSTVYLPGAMSAADAKAFHDNKGWNLLQAPAEEIWIAPAAGSSGSSSGIASVSGIGASLSSQPGSSLAVAAVSGVGASINAQPGSSAGIAAVSGVGASLFAGVGASNGIAAASGVGSSIAAGSAVGAAAGIASVSGIGASIAASIGSAYGSSSVNGVAGGAPSSGGHYAGVAYTGKRPRRDLVDRDREDIKRLIREQLSEAKAEIAKAEVPQEVKQQARAVIKPYQKGEAVDVQALQQEVIRVRNMLHMWEQQVRREREEDEELLFMFH